MPSILPMDPELQLVHDNISPSIMRYADITKRSLRDALARAHRGVTRRVMAITPPASENSLSSRGTLGREAFNAGKGKISRQLNAVFAPRTLKRKRRERHPDVEEIYRQHRRFRNKGVGVSVSAGIIHFVDRRKFLALRNRKWAAVGRLASGWTPSARFAELNVPQWVARHGTARGSVEGNFISDAMRITSRNYAPGAPGNVVYEMQRRIPYAVRYQRDAMDREIRYLTLYRSAIAAGIRPTRTLPPPAASGL